MSTRFRGPQLLVTIKNSAWKGDREIAPPAERAAEIADEFARREAAPHTLMITPAVLEIVAHRR